LGVKAPTCTGDAETHALLARPYVEEPMGRDVGRNRGDYRQPERQWDIVTQHLANDWFSVGPVVAAEPVDVDTEDQPEKSTLARIADALEAIADALK
tara:strand:+ start:368 stop:658 length:291 start_codon:yes stop_codon:yes gene_type:complete